jgi:flagellar basal-body rod modification protein FlgD
MTTTPLLGSSNTQSTTSTSSTSNPYGNLKAEDFINLMVTQLKNQDPTQPASNEALLAQMSQIGQLQSSTQLQTTLQNFGAQSQISSASSLIGKKVQGIDAQNNTITGVVSSVKVAANQVNLELDNGSALPLGNVTDVAASN